MATSDIRESHGSDQQFGDDIPAAPSEQRSQSSNPQTSKKPSMPVRIWKRSGLDVNMLLMMVKGALPPTIAIALYQSTTFADTYLTLGYLVAIMSILSFAIMPRAKFIQTMCFNILGICIGFCIALLSIYCSVQARAHTTPHLPPGPASSSGGPSPGASVSPYSSSASAVCAIWLFFNIYVSNMLRASRPQLQFPVIMYSIFASVSSTYAPQFATMAQGIAFARRLLEAFLAGFAIACGVSLFIFPLTSRKTVFRTSSALIGALRGALRAQNSYLESLGDKDRLRGQPKASTQSKSIDNHEHASPQAQTSLSQFSPEARDLNAAIASLGELHGKLNVDLTFAKREIACGKLDASELSELVKLMRQVMLPVIGMSSVADIFDRIAERRGWKTVAENHFDQPDRSEVVKDNERAQWSEIMQNLHQPFDTLTKAMDMGLQHVLLTLELEKRSKKQRYERASQQTGRNPYDLEAKGDAIEPGESGFAQYLSLKVDEFHEQRKLALEVWCRQKGTELEVVYSFQNQIQGPQYLHSDAPEDHQREQRQLYLILYVSLSFPLFVASFERIFLSTVIEGPFFPGRMLHDVCPSS